MHSQPALRSRKVLAKRQKSSQRGKIQIVQTFKNAAQNHKSPRKEATKTPKRGTQSSKRGKTIFLRQPTLCLAACISEKENLAGAKALVLSADIKKCCAKAIKVLAKRQPRPRKGAPSPRKEAKLYSCSRRLYVRLVASSKRSI